MSLTGFVWAQDLNFKEVQDLLKSGDKINILDTRELDEYQVSHLKGAVHVGYNHFNLEDVQRRVKFDRPTLVYCSVGYRSGKIVEVLRKVGIKAFNFDGGIFSWVNNGGLVYSLPGKLTDKVHGYNKKWSKKIKKGKVVLPKNKKWFSF